jgi:hypothetical protein
VAEDVDDATTAGLTTFGRRLGTHDMTLVPLPGALSTRNQPPDASARKRMVSNPSC